MLELDKNTFEAEVLQAPGRVVVDFYGDGCVPCAALMPHVHEFAEKYGSDNLKDVYKRQDWWSSPRPTWWTRSGWR